jgi:hypothetical protein
MKIKWKTDGKQKEATGNQLESKWHQMKIKRK